MEKYVLMLWMCCVLEMRPRSVLNEPCHEKTCFWVYDLAMLK